MYLHFTNAAVPKEEGQDKDCVTYDQYAAKIKSNLDISNETDSLQVRVCVLQRPNSFSERVK